VRRPWLAFNTFSRPNEVITEPVMDKDSNWWQAHAMAVIVTSVRSSSARGQRHRYWSRGRRRSSRSTLGEPNLIQWQKEQLRHVDHSSIPHAQERGFRCSTFWGPRRTSQIAHETRHLAVALVKISQQGKVSSTMGLLVAWLVAYFRQPEDSWIRDLTWY
jgi:hypothetical protein